MELAGLIIGAISLGPIIVEAVSTGRLYARDITYWSDDARKLSIRMNSALDDIESISQLLFPRRTAEEENNDGATKNSGLFERLDNTTRSSVCDIINEFNAIIRLRYEVLKTEYSLDQSSAQQQGRGSIRFKMSWSLHGKRKVLAVVEECEDWSKRLLIKVQLHLLTQVATSISSSTFREIVVAARANDAAARLGLKDDIVLAEMAVAGEDMSTDGEGNEYITELGGKVELDLESTNSSLQYGKYEGRMVLVEHKSFDARGQDPAVAEPQPEALRRITQLIRLLSVSHSPRSRLLHCEGYYRDPESASYSLVLDFPPGRTLQPRTLLELLECPEGAPRVAGPPLEKRLVLAEAVASALLQLHAVGWVHKSLSSKNIVFFPRDGSDAQDIITSPWVTGFEYSREDPGFSDQMPLASPSEDIYKHPERWGLPTRKFSKIHDIYSLGVILLEIGIWQPARRLELNGFRNLLFVDRFGVRDLFARKTREKLPFAMGSRYADVVGRCLMGEFDMETPGELTPQELQEQVVEILQNEVLNRRA